MILAIIDIDNGGYGWKRYVRAANGEWGYPRDTKDRAWIVELVAEWELDRIAQKWEELGGNYIGDVLTDQYGESYLVDVMRLEDEASLIDFRPMPETPEEELGENSREIVVRTATREEVREAWEDSRDIVFGGRSYGPRRRVERVEV